MNLSCCLWALSGPEEESLSALAGMGFSSLDIRPIDLTREATRLKARELGLHFSCLGASFGLPEGVTLDSLEPQTAAQALASVEDSLDYAAELGITTVYVVPGLNRSPEALAAYALSLAAAAGKAQELGIKLCIEHFPGRALPTAAATLDFLQELGHPNLYLLFDLGHIQMSKEDPVAVLRAAGGRLGYVHLDDNDGELDQHLALLDGVMTETSLARTLSTLPEIGYTGAVSLELNPALANPLEAIRHSREVVLKVAQIG